ncbi:hypothetical protein M0804_006609 [Polistes exclamans]|nr:hypothetical protein M0804_006609 [Polistes exclamans]
MSRLLVFMKLRRSSLLLRDTKELILIAAILMGLLLFVGKLDLNKKLPLLLLIIIVVEVVAKEVKYLVYPFRVAINCGL